MPTYIVSRVAQAFVTLVVVMVVVFFLSHASGDTAALMLPDTASKADVEAMRHTLGTDRPLPIQLAHFVKRAVTVDLGVSTRSRKPVTELMAKRLPKSAQLGGLAFGISITVAILLGTTAAVWRNGPLDVIARLIGIMGQSMPNFWIAIVAIEIFAVKFRILPVSGAGGPNHFILPVAVMSWPVVAGLMRLLRAQMIEVLESDYVRTARAKGLSPRLVIFRHALRNGLIPVVSYAGLYFAVVVTGSVVIETVFAWPGMGQLAQQAVSTRDFPLLQGIVLLSATVIVLANLTVDLLYGVVDPRVNVRR